MTYFSGRTRYRIEMYRCLIQRKCRGADHDGRGRNDDAFIKYRNGAENPPSRYHSARGLHGGQVLR